jgi:hypothetical protein
MTDYNKKYQEIYERTARENKQMSHEQIRIITNQKFGEYCFKRGTENRKVDISINPIYIKHHKTLHLICEKVGVEFKHVTSPLRERDIVNVRQCIMYHLKTIKRYSLKPIGHLFGGRDHSTVIHAIQTHENLYGIDKPYTEISDMVKAEFLKEKATKENITAEFNGQGTA